MEPVRATKPVKLGHFPHSPNGVVRQSLGRRTAASYSVHSAKPSPISSAPNTAWPGLAETKTSRLAHVFRCAPSFAGQRKLFPARLEMQVVWCGNAADVLKNPRPGLEKLHFAHLNYIAITLLALKLQVQLQLQLLWRVIDAITITNYNYFRRCEVYHVIPRRGL